MKKILVILVLALAFVLTACGGHQVTSEMRSSMEGYARNVDLWHPEQENVVRECLYADMTVYWNETLRSYAATCELKRLPNSFGVVTFDEWGGFLNAFPLDAKTQGEVTTTLGLLGWKR